MRTPTTEQIMRAFCAKEPARYDMKTPWVLNGYKYATNGRAAARHKADEPNSPPTSEGSRPPCGTLFVVTPQTRFVLTEPEKMPPAPKRCGWCEGTGGRECNLGHFHDCESCDGRGKADYDPNMPVLMIVKGLGLSWDLHSLLWTIGVREVWHDYQDNMKNPPPMRAAVGDIEIVAMPSLIHDGSPGNCLQEVRDRHRELLAELTKEGA
jgi:hypothetical protein